MKSRSMTVSGLIFFMFLGVSSVRADSIHAHNQIQDLNRGQQIKLGLLNVGPEGRTYLWQQHANNGKHLGFSIASMRQSPKLDLVGFYDKRTATPNPEPATMILLGTGLVAAGVYARKRRRH